MSNRRAAFLGTWKVLVALTVGMTTVVYSMPMDNDDAELVDLLINLRRNIDGARTAIRAVETGIDSIVKIVDNLNAVQIEQKPVILEECVRALRNYKNDDRHQRFVHDVDGIQQRFREAGGGRGQAFMNDANDAAYTAVSETLELAEKLPNVRDLRPVIARARGLPNGTTVMAQISQALVYYGKFWSLAKDSQQAGEIAKNFNKFLAILADIQLQFPPTRPSGPAAARPVGRGRRSTTAQPQPAAPIVPEVSQRQRANSRVRMTTSGGAVTRRPSGDVLPPNNPTRAPSPGSFADRFARAPQRFKAKDTFPENRRYSSDSDY